MKNIDMESVYIALYNALSSISSLYLLTDSGIIWINIVLYGENKAKKTF